MTRRSTALRELTRIHQPSSGSARMRTGKTPYVRLFNKVRQMDPQPSPIEVNQLAAHLFLRSRVMQHDDDLLFVARTFDRVRALADTDTAERAMDVLFTLIPAAQLGVRDPFLLLLDLQGEALPTGWTAHHHRWRWGAPAGLLMATTPIQSFKNRTMQKTYELDSNIVTNAVHVALWKALKKYGLSERPYDASPDMGDDLGLLWNHAEDAVRAAVRLAVVTRNPELQPELINTLADFADDIQELYALDPDALSRVSVPNETGERDVLVRIETVQAALTAAQGNAQPAAD